MIDARTSKQSGDIAGSKLLKFFNHLNNEIKIFFEIKNKWFEYDGKKSAKYFFVAKSRGEVICKGPELNKEKNLEEFRKKHKRTFIRGKRIYAKDNVNFSMAGFIENWKNKNKKRMEEMYIDELKIINI